MSSSRARYLHMPKNVIMDCDITLRYNIISRAMKRSACKASYRSVYRENNGKRARCCIALTS